MNPLSKLGFPARLPVLIGGLVLLPILAACTPMTGLVLHGGEQPERRFTRAHREGPYVLIFALDGVGHDQMAEALRSGSKPWMSELLGAERGNGVFEHAYAVPNALSILPSTTPPGWSAIFTGQAPAYNGVPGNEWFLREEMRFLAPTPTSVEETDDVRRAVGEDLVGKALEVPTLFDLADGPCFVSLNYVHRGADLYTTDEPAVLAALMTEFKAGKLVGATQLLQNGYAEFDVNSVPKVIDAIRKHGVPTVQVVYFPGIDLYTHLAENPLHDQVGYLEEVTFPLVEAVLGEYRRQHALDDTYVMFVSDHGHTPVLMDSRHALAAEPEKKSLGLLQSLGFRVRPIKLEVGDSQSDYQAVLSYQAGMAYVYLADRSTCLEPGQKCDWSKPPRFEQDVLPVARAFYRESQAGGQFPALKGTLDLVFARRPVALTEDTREYAIYDGAQPVAISRYLEQHRRPDLIRLDRRMWWLSAGPHGHRAGDVVLLAKSGLERPIEDRYYFSEPYRSQHGSASAQDSHIVLMLARQGVAGEALRKTIAGVAGEEPSQLDVVPLIRTLLKKPRKVSAK